MTNLLLCLTILGAFVALGAAQFNFTCPPLPSRQPPTSVHQLHPNDVKVVLSLGDSITAGFGVMGYAGGLNEFRGKSWAMGGDEGAITLPAFLGMYRSDIVGSSLGKHILELCPAGGCPAPYHPELDVLNGAQSGAKLVDLPGQLKYVLEQLASKPVNMTHDWKVFTLWIGANDLCGACQSNPLTPDQWTTNMRSLLEQIRTSIPRVFVNLIPTFNLSQVYDLASTSPYCSSLHKIFSECSCIFNKNTTMAPEYRQIVDQTGQAFNARLKQIAAEYQQKNYSDFAVVYQPFNQDTMIRDYSLDFLSGIDCFHPSLKAHEGMAVALWNAMITPAAKKKTTLDPADPLLCPTADSLFYTY